MAVSGLRLLGYVFMHLLGNLSLFLGPQLINAYAVKLHSLGPGLWVARIVLLVAVVLHIVTSIRLTIENRLARPVGYHHPATIETTYAARTMAFSGIIILAFIMYHILHFTVGIIDPKIAALKDAQGHHDVYSMVVLSFKNPWVAASYLVAVFLLCSHLSHGISSFFQSLGWADESSIPFLQKAGKIVALLLFLGYASIPLSSLLGLLNAQGAHG
jgi:succinate dehydrogenase / fumarate reductase cytochrome b subunit